MLEAVDVSQTDSGSWLTLWGMVAHWRFSVGCCCWQTGHSAVAAARLTVVSGSPCCWVYTWSPSLLPRTLFSRPHWTMTGVPGWLNVTIRGKLVFLKSNLCNGNPLEGLNKEVVQEEEGKREETNSKSQNRQQRLGISEISQNNTLGIED